jgi:hypothetical protein
MGCWNGTCGLTNLPIQAYDEIYVFPIVEQYKGNSFCYTHALYRPCIVPFRAVYNDYGGGEQCHGVALDFIINGLKSQLIEMEQGENPYHDVKVSRDKFDANSFFDIVHEGRLFIKNPMRGYEDQPETLNVYFTMVRKDVVDEIRKSYTFDLWNNSKSVPSEFKTNRYYIKNVTYEKLEAYIPEYLEHTINHNQSKYKGERTEKSDLLLREFFFLRSDHILDGIFERIFHGASAYEFFMRNEMKLTILAALASGNKILAVNLLKELMTGVLVNHLMSNTRKVWLPPMHQGSQSEFLETYKFLNKVTDQIIEKKEICHDI